MPACSQGIRMHGNSALKKMRLDSYDKPTQPRMVVYGCRAPEGPSVGIYRARGDHVTKNDAEALATTRESSKVDFVFVRQSKKTTPQDRRGYRERPWRAIREGVGLQRNLVMRTRTRSLYPGPLDQA
jgi:hypothetical protein